MCIRDRYKRYGTRSVNSVLLFTHVIEETNAKWTIQKSNTNIYKSILLSKSFNFIRQIALSYDFINFTVSVSYTHLISQQCCGNFSLREDSQVS